MRIRTFSQIMLSNETDSWSKQLHGSLCAFNVSSTYIETNAGTVSYIGTANGTSHLGGTISISIDPIAGGDRQFVTGLSVSSDKAGCYVDIMDGTAFLYAIKLPIISSFVDHFDGLKGSLGTSLNIHLSNMWGTMNFNIQGYTVK